VSERARACVCVCVSVRTRVHLQVGCLMSLLAPILHSGMVIQCATVWVLSGVGIHRTASKELCSPWGDSMYPLKCEGIQLAGEITSGYLSIRLFFNPLIQKKALLKFVPTF
jgi:hypothetical protein